MTGDSFAWRMSSDGKLPKVYGRIPPQTVLRLSSDRTFKECSGSSAIQSMAEEVGLNARYVGAVRSGGTIVFERVPGVMRLRVLTPGGDAAYSPDYILEKGKKYTVEYSYSGPRFTISERP